MNEAANGEPHVSRHTIEKREHTLVVPALRDRLRAAEPEDRCATSVGGTQALPNVVLGQQLEVSLEFGGDVLSIATPDRGQEAMHESACALHDDSAFKAKNLAMISPVRSQ